MFRRSVSTWLVLCSIGLAWAAPLAFAQTGPDQSIEEIAEDESSGDSAATAVDEAVTEAEPDPREIADATDPGHNAWMMVSAALVLFMTAPGLAMFYSGLVRRKNVLSVMMQCIFLMGLMTVIWAVYGFSLAFGGDGKYIGDASHLFMKGVAREWVEGVGGAAGHDYTPMFSNGKIPMITFMLFQGMFFIITPALICGAFAERMKFSSMVLFSILWGTLVYCPLCHWVWDAGLLGFVNTETMQAGGGNGIMGGALDFAGGTVVHISSGVSALVCALVIGKRLGYGKEPMPPHNLTYTALGAAMLWVGWFGFNAGSELLSDGLAASAFATTHFSAAAGALSWAGMEWLLRKKASVLGACSGAVAGLVCITPAAGFVNLMPALLFGLAAGIVCYFACTVLKSKLGYDDSLDAFGVHGVGGTLGAVLTGVFATRAAWNYDNGGPMGLLEGNSRILIGQIVAVIITWVLAAVATFIILKVLDLTIGLRPTQEQETQGLDISQHGEEGYINM